MFIYLQYKHANQGAFPKKQSISCFKKSSKSKCKLCRWNNDIIKLIKFLQYKFRNEIPDVIWTKTSNIRHFGYENFLAGICSACFGCFNFTNSITFQHLQCQSAKLIPGLIVSLFKASSPLGRPVITCFYTQISWIVKIFRKEFEEMWTFFLRT